MGKSYLVCHDTPDDKEPASGETARKGWGPLAPAKLLVGWEDW